MTCVVIAVENTYMVVFFAFLNITKLIQLNAYVDCESCLK